jgi:hypothetical protein
VCNYQQDSFGEVANLDLPCMVAGSSDGSMDKILVDQKIYTGQTGQTGQTAQELSHLNRKYGM